MPTMKEDGYEVVSMAPVEAQDRRMAKMRQRRCVVTPAEQSLYAYDPNEARTNDRPGYPDPEYGESIPMQD